MSFIKAEITRDEIEDFRKLTESMSPSDKSFAISLASQFETHGLSTKQVYWVRTLMERYIDSVGTTGTMAPKKKQYATQDIGRWMWWPNALHRKRDVEPEEAAGGRPPVAALSGEK